jgi:hypothetical protein
VYEFSCQFLDLSLETRSPTFITKNGMDDALCSVLEEKDPKIGRLEISCARDHEQKRSERCPRSRGIGIVNSRWCSQEPCSIA